MNSVVHMLDYVVEYRWGGSLLGTCLHEFVVYVYITHDTLPGLLHGVS